jgi:hypothetical protein
MKRSITAPDEIIARPSDRIGTPSAQHESSARIMFALLNHA